MKRVGIILTLCVLLLITSCTAPEVLPQDVACRIYFLNVGQGDCTLIRTQHGDVLIDSGPESAQEELCLRLEQLGVVELVLAVFTHPDEDHIGGADGVLAQIPTKEVWLPDAEADNDSARRMESAIQKSGARRRTVTVGDSLQLGELFICVFSPLTTAADASSNDSSIVLKATFGTVGMMFMGDAGVQVEEMLLQNYGKAHFRASLYKVGHHGSTTSNSTAWLEAVQPEYAVISSSADNAYGHPHGAVVLSLEEMGVQVLRTATMGEIVFECDGTELYLLNEIKEKA